MFEPIISNKYKIINSFLGAGKTTKLVNYIISNRKDNDNVIALRTIPELISFSLMLYRELIRLYTTSASAKREFFHRFHFLCNYKYEDYKNEIDFILKNCNRPETNFIMSLSCTTKFKNFKKNVITTHETLLNQGKTFKNYNVYIDESPQLTFELSHIKANADLEAYKAAHVASVDFSYNKHLQPTSLGLKFVAGTLELSELGCSDYRHFAIHLCRSHPFKSCTMLTAFAETTLHEWFKLIGKENFLIYENPDDKLLIRRALDLMVVTTLNLQKQTLKNSKEVINALLEYNRDYPALLISTSSQEVEKIRYVTNIRTNKTGINSLTDFDRVLIGSQLNFSNNEKAALLKLFSPEELQELEESKAAIKILQSIFRSRIRKGQPIEVVFGSVESKERVIKYLENLLEN